MKKILVLGPNPAWQKTLFFDGFNRDKVNRAAEMRLSASGKGINFCRAARCCGKATTHLVQFCGGDTGKAITGALQNDGFEATSVMTCQPTRCCTTCLDRTDETMTEIIEPSYPATAAETAEFLTAVRQQEPACDALACCGTLPTGTDASLYAQAAALFGSKPVLVDAFKEIGGLFASGRRVILKINREELQKLTGVSGIPAALKALFDRPDAPSFAAITDGGEPAYASDGRKIVRYELPRLEKVINPLGSGDTASAVLLSEIVTGNSPLEAFVPALAAASANCLETGNGFFRLVSAAQIASAIRISEFRG